jgi:hypothetical protein
MNSAKIPLTRLYRKVSASTGQQYFVGRLGSARVLLFKDRDQPAEGDEVFTLLIEAVADDAEAPAPSPQKKRIPNRHERNNVVAALRRIGERLEADDAEATVSQTRTP